MALEWRLPPVYQVYSSCSLLLHYMVLLVNEAFSRILLLTIKRHIKYNPQDNKWDSANRSEL